MGAHSDSNWQNAFVQRTIHQTAAAQQQNFERTMVVQQRMHEQFMATMQRGTDMSMARAQANMDARSTAASDWVDYALDQRTVMDPNTGQTNQGLRAHTATLGGQYGQEQLPDQQPECESQRHAAGNLDPATGGTRRWVPIETSLFWKSSELAMPSSMPRETSPSVTGLARWLGNKHWAPAV